MIRIKNGGKEQKGEFGFSENQIKKYTIKF